MRKKYFFFDIDGTITNRETGIPVPSAIEALHKLEEAGHFVAIATGRAQYKASKFLSSVGLTNMVCAGGGCLVVENEIIHNLPLDNEKAKAIADQATSLGYGIIFALKDSDDVYGKDDLFLKQVGERKEPTTYHIDPSFDYHKEPVIMKMYIAIPQEEEEKLTLKDTLGNLRFEKEYLMYQHDAKHQGILDMMNYIQGNLEDVVVFGDDTNDLDMFDPNWTCVAMGNATDELKAKATFVTKANVDDGIWYACETFHWFDPVEE